jgi:hypothetical protein
MIRARVSVISILTAILLAFCVGAIWPVIGLMRRSDAPWMVFVAAAVAIYAVRMIALHSRWMRVIAALSLTAISIAYAQYLAAAAVVTSVIGIPFRAVLTSMGPEMAFAVARARMSTSDAILIDAGLLLAAIGAVALRPRTLSPGAPRQT